ncbi:MAG: HAD family hydrolase [Candidatus Koribacter versatilis]|uniref:phosphoglycolate phosphatase n=1 Tax=Candidatus Korobacter versatilis TaxID=658062 RepID=A0A932A6U2_9BACT|nr:HAD family hydrolase [Candidatus Koribacter versatilis]
MSLSSNRRRWLEGDAYLFDIDGTLLNSRDGVHYQAFHSAIQAVFGVSSRIDGVPVHGNTDLGIVRAVLEREGVSPAIFERDVPRLIAHMGEEVTRNAAQLAPELCPAIFELLTLLQSKGKLLGVVSGNLERIGWLKLEASGLRPFFAFGSFSDHHESREDIFRVGIAEARRRLGRDLAEIYVVGDTPADIRAARMTGVPVIVLATGIFPFKELSAHRPDGCFACCTDLLAAG